MFFFLYPRSQNSLFDKVQVILYRPLVENDAIFSNTFFFEFLFKKIPIYIIDGMKLR